MTSGALIGQYRAMEPPSRPYSHHDDARRLTGDLRTSDEPRWAAVRQHLIESGFDPQRSAVGDLFPEDIGDFGVLVASDRTTHTFEVGTEPIRGERGKYRIWVTHEEATSARSRYAYASAMFAAMKLLESEERTDVQPLDLLIESLAVLTEEFRDTAERRWDDLRAEDYWDVLHAFMRDRSIDPMKSVPLHWAWTSTPEIDGGLLDPSGRSYHFTCALEDIHGPITEVVRWDELDPTAARSIYGDDFDAGMQLLRKEGEGRYSRG